jgi:chromosome segregation and condensation protein ScpB
METAIEEFLRSRDPGRAVIYTTSSRFIGKFSRAEAYRER